MMSAPHISVSSPHVSVPKPSAMSMGGISKGNQSFGPPHPGFKFRVRPVAMMTAYPGAQKALAFPSSGSYRAYK
jgi:hypothetical protein